jgi:hypothetical protein
MPDYSVTIGGIEREVRLDGLDLASVTNGLDTFACVVQSEAAAYRPAVRDPIVFLVDGTPRFGGIITQAQEEAWGGPALTDILTRVSATSFDIYASYRFFTGQLAAGTLKSQLTTLVALLSSYGVTLHASQVDGPAMEVADLTRERVDKVLTRLSETSGYVWSIDADKYLRMVDPTGVSAPFDILDSGTQYQVGDIKVERTLDDSYANRVTVVVNGAGPATSTETFTAADGVSAGGYTTFTAKYPASQSIQDAYPNQLIIDGAYVSAPIGFGATQLPTDSNWYWDYTASPAELVYPEVSGQIFPDASSPAEEITITYAIGFPFTVQADNAADQALYGIRESVVVISQAMTIEAAQAYADALVDSNSAVRTKITYYTRTDGLRPNMAQTVTVSKRNVNASYVITDVRMSHANGDDNESMFYTVNATNTLTGNWRQQYRDWLGGGDTATGGNVVPSGGAASSSVGPPDKAVQFNRNGSFGGSEDFKFYEDVGSVACGEGSTMDEDAVGCSAMGYDCHIGGAW